MPWWLFAQRTESFDVSLATVGLTGGTSLTVDGQFDIDVAELRADWKATLPAILGTII